MKQLVRWLKFNRPVTIFLARVLKKRLRLGYKDDAPLWLELTTWLSVNNSKGE